MLAKRIIPCLDIHNGHVVKGIQFRNHKIVGDIIKLAIKYANSGADELVFYDITASAEKRLVDKMWVSRVAKVIDIPFCVAGGIQSVDQAEKILSLGADKISINSPAIQDSRLIARLSERFGAQCIVIGIDSFFDKDCNEYYVKQYTGDEKCMRTTKWKTADWVQEVQKYGIGEIVINVINQDGLQNGYDLKHLKKIRKICNVPLIASGGAGKIEHFYEAFDYANVDATLAASVFHQNVIEIKKLKKFLIHKNIEVRLC